MRRRRLVHLTTVDLSLELLLGPQLSAFVDAGYEVIGMSAPGPWVGAIEARGVRHVPVRNATRAMAPGKDLRAIPELVSAFRRLRPDIVHTHNPKPGLYGRLAGRAARVPVVLNTVHGLYATPEDHWRKRAAIYGMERVASMFSDAELVQNPEDIPTLRRVLHEPASKLVLLGNGIDLTRFHPDGATRSEVRDELGIDPDAVVVLAVGRLVLEKGYAELFDAWHEVRAAHPDALLVVAGPLDPDKADAVPGATLEAAEADGVMLLGMRDDVERLYRAADAYVLASHREGFPRSAMEAAASGLAIVATDIRGCRQVVDDGVTGRLVPVRSADGLAAAIAELAGDADQRRKMGAAAVERAHAEFDQQRQIERTLATYDRLLTAHGRDSPEGTTRGRTA